MTLKFLMRCAFSNNYTYFLVILRVLKGRVQVHNSFGSVDYHAPFHDSMIEHDS